MANAHTVVLLTAHGSPDDLNSMPEFLTRVRRGRAPPPELVHEVRRRYTAIGGRSPLTAITRDVARQLSEHTGLSTEIAMRLWHPFIPDVLTALCARGVNRVISLPLAPFSVHVYNAAVVAAAGAMNTPPEVLCAPSWATHPALVQVFARTITQTVATVPQEHRGQLALVMSAHSLPVHVIKSGDPYEREVRACADAIVELLAATGQSCAQTQVCWQSQGATTDTWLEPTLEQTLRSLKERGTTHVVVAPIGFICDHVETLYDLDIEAQQLAHTLGLTLYRAPTPGASGDFVATLATIVNDCLRTH